MRIHAFLILLAVAGSVHAESGPRAGRQPGRDRRRGSPRSLADGVQHQGPKGAYDSVTIEDGGRRLVQSAKDKHPAKLGDKAWSDNARISYTLDGHPVQ